MGKEVTFEIPGVGKVWYDHEAWWKEQEWVSFRERHIPHGPSKEQERRFWEDLDRRYKESLIKK
jgi:hypothetical protein